MSSDATDKPVRFSAEANGRGATRIIITGPRGRAASSWWHVDDGSAEQEAGERYCRLPYRAVVPPNTQEAPVTEPRTLPCGHPMECASTTIPAAAIGGAKSCDWCIHVEELGVAVDGLAAKLRAERAEREALVARVERLWEWVASKWPEGVECAKAHVARILDGGGDEAPALDVHGAVVARGDCRGGPHEERAMPDTDTDTYLDHDEWHAREFGECEDCGQRLADCDCPVCTCDGSGVVITCFDDLCHGLGRCIHGDGEEYCDACN